MFLYLLAKDLGKTVKQLRSELSTHEFMEWKIAYRIWYKASRTKGARR